MSRIKNTFAQLKTQQQKALIPYVTAGDPNLEMTLALMHAMVEAGANLIELGVPFSDPMADGPVIQKASERALEHDTSLLDIFSLVSQFRQDNNETPIILMGYLNPIEVMGYTKFIQLSKEAGVDAVLTVDFPPEESEDFVKLLNQNDMDCIFLLSPTTTEQRIEYICQYSSGFVYYVSVKGVTGSAQLDADAIAQRLDLIHHKTDLPIGVGFGIKDAQTAKSIGQFADAIIVGSANVKLIEQGIANNLDNQAIIGTIVELLSSIRKAID